MFGGHARALPSTAAASPVKRNESSDLLDVLLRCKEDHQVNVRIFDSSLSHLLKLYTCSGYLGILCVVMPINTHDSPRGV